MYYYSTKNIIVIIKIWFIKKKNENNDNLQWASVIQWRIHPADSNW